MIQIRSPWGRFPLFHMCMWHLLSGIFDTTNVSGVIILSISGKAATLTLPLRQKIICLKTRLNWVEKCIGLEERLAKKKASSFLTLVFQSVMFIRVTCRKLYFAVLWINDRKLVGIFLYIVSIDENRRAKTKSHEGNGKSTLHVILAFAQQPDSPFFAVVFMICIQNCI